MERDFPVFALLFFGAGLAFCVFGMGMSIRQANEYLEIADKCIAKSGVYVRPKYARPVCIKRGSIQQIEDVRPQHAIARTSSSACKNHWADYAHFNRSWCWSQP